MSAQSIKRMIDEHQPCVDSVMSDMNLGVIKEAFNRALATGSIESFAFVYMTAVAGSEHPDHWTLRLTIDVGDFAISGGGNNVAYDVVHVYNLSVYIDHASAPHKSVKLGSKPRHIAMEMLAAVVELYGRCHLVIPVPSYPSHIVI